MANHWYVIHVYSGFEKKVAEAIQEQVEKAGLSESISEVLVPTESVSEVRRGQRVKAERKFFPGYILIKMAMNDVTWHLVSSTPKVSGFLGAGKRPLPISSKEAERILNQIEEGVEKPKSNIIYEIGELVRVCDGPFTSFTGLVEDIDDEKSRLKVAVSIFGRATPVDLDYSQVEKTL